MSTPLLRQALKEYLIRCELQEFSPKTVRLYRHDLIPFLSSLETLGIFDFVSIAPTHIEAFLASAKARGCSPHSIDRFRRNIRTFLSNFASRYDLPQIDFQKVARPRLPDLPPKALDIAEVRQLISLCGESPRDKRDAVLMQLLFDSALRISEALSLKVENIDFETGLVVIERGKGSRARTLMLNAPTITALQGHIASLPPKTEYVFPSTRTGQHLASCGIQARFRRLAQKVGIKATAHMFRHGCARFMAINNAGPNTIADRLGHRTTNLANHYSKLFATEALERGKQFSPGANL